jgi:ribonucleoside-triphosphate reductase
MHALPLYPSFIHQSRYARWLPESNRRETWTETISRYFDFFREHLHSECSLNYEAFDLARSIIEPLVLAREVMPSMRAVMTAGLALSNARTWRASTAPTSPSTARLRSMKSSTSS